MTSSCSTIARSAADAVLDVRRAPRARTGTGRRRPRAPGSAASTSRVTALTRPLSGLQLADASRSSRRDASAAASRSVVGDGERPPVDRESTSGGPARTRGSAAGSAPRASARSRGMPFSSRSSRNRTICSGMAASASIRSARSSASGLSASSSTWSRTDARTAARSASTSGWSNQRNRTLRARSPTMGNRSWVASTSRSSTSRAAAASVGSAGTGLVHPVLQQRHDQLHVRRRTLLGEEHPEHRVLELAGPVEARRRRSGAARAAAAARNSSGSAARSMSSVCRIGVEPLPWASARGSRRAGPRRPGGCG